MSQENERYPRGTPTQAVVLAAGLGLLVSATLFSAWPTRATAGIVGLAGCALGLVSVALRIGQATRIYRARRRK